MSTAGNITRRGKTSWRLKYEGGEPDPSTGRRVTRYVTFRGTKKEAQVELARLLDEIRAGTAVEPTTTTLAEYLRGWLNADASLAPKTLERYRQLVEQQIIPHLGATPLQKLRPAQIDDWHGLLLKRGGKDGRPLSARTVGHAHRVLRRGLERALRLEIVSRNVAAAFRPPKVEATEVVILSPDEMADMLAKLEDHTLYPIVSLALGSGMRRGELCGLAWGALDLEKAVVRVERSLEETGAGLRFKPPKSRAGRRTVSLPANVVEVLRDHRRQQLQMRLLLGQGRAGANDLVFTLADGSPYPPDKLSRDWLRITTSRKLPRVMFHSLRHSHVSALIAAGLDVVAVSRRIGHASPAVTLAVYAHLFQSKDDAAAAAIEAAMRPKNR
jgi:integrase